MGIISRFADIMKANINDLLDKCEDPEKMFDQMLRDLNDNLAKVKKETAGVMADETRAKRNLDASKEEVAKWQGYVNKAIDAGNDGDAEKFIIKMNAAQAKVTQDEKVYALAKDNADKMRAMHDKLVSDIQTLEGKRDTLRATNAVAKAQETVNKATSKADVAGAMSRVESYESKINDRLDRAMAEAELNSRPADETEDLTGKYDGTASNSDVKAQLAAMKAARQAQ